MKQRKVRHFVLLSSFLGSAAAASPPLSSPIKHLEGSLAASVAQSTTVAVQKKDFCVLVSRSPAVTSTLLAEAFTPQQEADASGSNVHGVNVDLGRELSSSSRKWQRLTSSTVCTMTGFAADVAHLTSVLERQVESYQTLYSQSHPIHKTIRQLSRILQRAAQREGGRPFGVQALLVGRDQNKLWQLYIVDPAGAWRHYGNGVAVIGRHGEKVKEQLKEMKEARVENAKDAVELAINLVLSGFQKENTMIDSECFEGLLVWVNEDGACQMATIVPELMEKCYQECLERLNATRR